jgi:hypothetical protein
MLANPWDLVGYRYHAVAPLPYHGSVANEEDSGIMGTVAMQMFTLSCHDHESHQ